MYINGYKICFHPESSGCFKCDKHKGWMYEHRYVAERILGRCLKENEVVHHIDHDRSNNIPNNLKIMTKKSHAMLHGEEHRKDIRLCAVCGSPLSSRRRTICRICRKQIANSKYPNNDIIYSEVIKSSYSAVGRKYGVTGVAIKKRLKAAGYNLPTMKNQPKSIYRQMSESVNELVS